MARQVINTLRKPQLLEAGTATRWAKPQCVTAVQVLTTLLPIQLPANGPGHAAENGPALGDSAGVPDPWPLPGPDLPAVASD